MNIVSVMDQLDVLVAIANDLKSYLTTIKTANTHAGVQGYEDGAKDALHDKHTWYGVSEYMIEEIQAAKTSLANAKKLANETTNI